MTHYADTVTLALDAGAILVQINATGGVDYWLPGDELPDWATQEPVPSILDITSWQLTQALIELGMIGAVESLIASTTDPYIKYGWQQATIYSRNDPVVIAAKTGLGMTDEEVDALFLFAASK